jgi:hypothetical protein
MTKRSHFIQREDLQAAVVGLLRASPRTLNELARLTGYSCAAVNLRLYALCEEGEAYRQSEIHPISGKRYVWHLDRDDAPLASPITPKCVRDPFVAALFGAAPGEH